jgi:hypothetical protein
MKPVIKPGAIVKPVDDIFFFDDIEARVVGRELTNRADRAGLCAVVYSPGCDCASWCPELHVLGLLTADGRIKYLFSSQVKIIVD